jgi:hypothetical protein
LEISRSVAQGITLGALITKIAVGAAETSSHLTHPQPVKWGKSHVVKTSRLAHNIRRMSRKEPKRSGGSDQNKAIARWDNEGGAPKGAPQDDRNELAPLTNEEEHILRRLGAAVIMQWNDLPTKIQRELFEHATSMGELNHTAELKGQVARFLHQHKDDGRESA